MKKLLALVLALAMVFCFCACGDSNSSAPADNTSNNSSAPANNSSNASAPADSSAPADTSAPADISEPTRDNGPWASAYAMIDDLAEQAKAFDGVAAQYNFTLACHDPVNSAPGEFLTAWADAVTVATEGRVDFNIGYGGTLSPTMQSLEDMKSGLVDFDWTLPCYFKGTMPLVNIIQNPGLNISNATVGSNVMWDLYKSSSDIQAECADDGEVLFLWANCTSPLSYKGSAEITSLSEVNGNIRGNNGPAQTFVKEVGADVYGCPIGEVQTNVSSGVIKYLITDWHGIKSFALSDPGVLNYYLDTNVGCSAYVLMANNDIWGTIDADTQAAIKSVSGDYLLDMVAIWDYWEASGRYGALSNGGTIFEPSDALAAELTQAYDNVAATWVSEQADPATAQALYDQAKGLVDQYSAQFDW